MTNMTIGQRIASGRKRLGLSQEALGERLGVSRQSIYKWESDAALPEIDKLVALSRLFGLSVGELLGVEEPAEKGEEAPAWDGELTEQQLKMVEEIVSRYLASQPEKKKKRWPTVLAVCAAVALIWGGLRLMDTLGTIQNNYNNLANSVNNISYSVSSQIGSISNRVEEILQQQNSLLAEYSVDIQYTDLAASKVTFAASVVPKTYTEGLEALFIVESAGVRSEFPATMGAGQRFAAEVTCELTDAISVGVVLVQDGVRQTQLLQQYSYLYLNSFPELDSPHISAFIWADRLTLRSPEAGEEGDAVLMIEEHERYVHLRKNDSESAKLLYEGQEPVVFEEIRIGMFLNNELYQWYEPSEQPDTYHGFEDYDFWFLDAPAIPLNEGDVLTVLVVGRDNYGREKIQESYDYVQLVRTEDGFVMERAAPVTEVGNYTVTYS